MQHDRYETLLAFCQTMSWATGVETVYQRLVDVSCECFECDAAHLHLLEIDGHTFAKHAYHDPANLFQMAPITTNIGRMSNLMENRTLIIMDDYEHPHSQDVIPPEALKAGYKSAISIPLFVDEQVLGMLSIVYKTPLPWTEDDHEFLLDMGKVMGIFIQRVQMSKKELELQMLRERKQLSSEIHDNLSQMVSALAIRADIARSCYDDGDFDALGDELDHMGEQARQVTKVLREEMLSLRTPIDEEGDIAESIGSLLERFESQWGISTELSVNVPSTLVMSDSVQLQLVRIVNECLQNVLRHARASKVDVVLGLGSGGGGAIITISDNGCGFDVEAVAPERLGLRIMRERAASTGGALSITSGDAGTTVCIEMPARLR